MDLLIFSFNQTRLRNLESIIAITYIIDLINSDLYKECVFHAELQAIMGWVILQTSWPYFTYFSVCACLCGADGVKKQWRTQDCKGPG